MNKFERWSEGKTVPCDRCGEPLSDEVAEVADPANPDRHQLDGYGDGDGYGGDGGDGDGDGYGGDGGDGYGSAFTSDV